MLDGMQTRFRAFIRGMCLGVDPSLAFRTTGVVVRYAGQDESLIQDWQEVGRDMRKMMEQFD